MVVLEGGAVSYERGTPVVRVTTQVKVMTPVKREECCVLAAKSFKSRGDPPRASKSQQVMRPKSEF